LILKLNDTAADSIELSHKAALDETILKMLHQKGVGGQAENDEAIETDLHFVLRKNDDEGLKLVLSVVEDRGYQNRVTVWRRDYDSLGRWTDQMIMRK
jgi:predicted GTPase